MWLDSAFESQAFAVSLEACRKDAVSLSLVFVSCVSKIVNSKSLTLVFSFFFFFFLFL